MMHAEKIAAELAEALDALQGEGTDGARLAAALRRIERQASSPAGCSLRLPRRSSAC